MFEYSELVVSDLCDRIIFGCGELLNLEIFLSLTKKERKRGGDDWMHDGGIVNLCYLYCDGRNERLICNNW